MGTFIRKHTPGESVTAGATISATLAATVPAGNNLLAIVAADTSREVASLSKPGGESASWVQVSSSHAGSTQARLSVWMIKTTVAWASATAVTATLSGSSTGKAIFLTEFNGVSSTAIATDHHGDIANSQTVAAAGLSAGDLSIAVGAVYAGGDSNVFCDYNIGGSSLVEPSGTVITDNLSVGFPLNNMLDIDIRMVIPVTTGDVSVRFGSFYNAGGTPIAYSAPLDAVLVFLASENYPPNAPTLTTMASGGVIDRAVVNRARHVFSDPNVADSQSAFDIRYRLTGTTTWSTISVVTPNQFYDFDAGTFAAGDYERQVRTYDSLGAVGPWSASGYFTAATKPAGPTITYPTTGSFVDQAETVTWSTPDQDVWQLRRVADDGTGSPVVDPTGGDIYWDSGEVTSSTTREAGVTFETNGRTEHLQLRVKNDGLWSDWTTVSVDVSYDTPPTPTFAIYVDAETASLVIMATNPEPGVDQEPTIHNDVYVDDGSGEERKATGVAVNGSWRYRTPVSGRDYSTAIRVVAVAANGTTASSA